MFEKDLRSSLTCPLANCGYRCASRVAASSISTVLCHPHKSLLQMAVSGNWGILPNDGYLIGNIMISYGIFGYPIFRQTQFSINWDVLGWFSDMVHSTRTLMVGSIFLFLAGVSMPIRDRSIVSEVSLWKTSNLYNTAWPQFPNYSRETYPIIPIASKSVVAAVFVVTTLTPLRINGAILWLPQTDRPRLEHREKAFQ